MSNNIQQNLNEHGILTVTLNRPEKLNALSYALLEELEIILTEAKLNSAVKGLLITGAGKAFCAGADISKLSEISTAHQAYKFACYGQYIFRELETLGKPSISAINGFAFGGGCELALATTMRIAAMNAKFGQPEVKLGVIPGYGGTQRLARLIGKGRALDLCLTGRFIDAETALNWGLINEVVSSELLLERANIILQSVLSMAPLAIASVMEVIDKGYDLGLNEALHLEAVHFAKVCVSDDMHEGVSAFLERREANFVGS